MKLGSIREAVEQLVAKPDFFDEKRCVRWLYDRPDSRVRYEQRENVSILRVMPKPEQAA